MAIQPIRRPSDDLPQARLYLDDIEEISKILRQAFTDAMEARRKETTSDPKPEIAIVYRIDDAQMDSIQDLVEYSHSATNFRLRVTSDGSYGAEFVIHSFWSAPELNLSYPIQEGARWSVHAQVKAILDYRQLRFKNGILRWPNWLKGLFYVLLSMTFPFILQLHDVPLRVALCTIWAVLAATI